MVKITIMKNAETINVLDFGLLMNIWNGRTVMSNQIQLVARLCKACVYATETDKPELKHAYLYCRLKCCWTMYGQHCSDFIPKRKYKGHVSFYIPDGD